MSLTPAQKRAMAILDASSSDNAEVRVYLDDEGHGRVVEDDRKIDRRTIAALRRDGLIEVSGTGRVTSVESKGWKWVYDRYNNVGFAKPMPTFHDTVEREGFKANLFNWGTSDFQYGVIGPDGSVEWYGGGRPGQTQLEYLKTIDPRAFLTVNYADDRSSGVYGWQFA